MRINDRPDLEKDRLPVGQMTGDDEEGAGGDRVSRCNVGRRAPYSDRFTYCSIYSPKVLCLPKHHISCS